MIIEDAFIRFEEVIPGDIFSFPGDVIGEDYYIKFNCPITTKDREEFNALDFLTGKPVLFMLDTQVRVITSFSYKRAKH